MKPKLLIRSARQLLTLRGPAGPRRGLLANQIGIIEDGAVLVDRGRVAAVGPSRRIENLSEARDARAINAAGRVVMPGFIDPHTHLISAPPRFSAGEETAGPEPVPQALDTTPGPRLQLEAMKMVRAAARHGTTSLEARSDYGSNQSSALKMLRSVRKIRGHPLTIVSGLSLTRPDTSFPDSDVYVQWAATELLERIRHRQLASVVDISINDREGFSIEQAAQFLRAARERGFSVKLRTHEYEPSPSIPLALEVDALSADYLNWISAEEIRYLARGRTVATLIPGRLIMGRNTRPPPARDLIDAGVPVALGTGFDHSLCPIINMQTVVGLAVRLLQMTPAEVITATTLNAAWAVGLEGCAGSLETGKDADLVILNLPDYRALAHYFGSNMVAMTVKSGEIVFRQGDVKSLES